MAKPPMTCCWTVPKSVALLPCKVRVTLELWLVARLPNLSWNWTTTPPVVPLIVSPATVTVGGLEKDIWLASAALTVTIASPAVMGGELLARAAVILWVTIGFVGLGPV